MRPSLRFQVLTRDGFRCAYCGRQAAEAELEVDHVLPVVEGGSDALENLLAACRLCNRGKGRRLLEGATEVPGAAERLAALRQRVAAAREAERLRAEERAIVDRQREEFTEAWCEAFGGERTAGGWRLPQYAPGFLSDGHVRSALARYGPLAMLEALAVVEERFWSRGSRRLPKGAVAPYFFGVLRGKEADAVASRRSS